MKLKQIILTALAVIGLSLSVKAQIPIDRWGANQISFLSNTVPTSGATPINAVIDCRYQGSVTFVFQGTYTASDTNNFAIYYQRGDGIHYETATNLMNFTANGTTPTTSVVTISTLGYGYLYLTAAVNNSSTHVYTNNYFSYQIKTRDQ